MRLHCNSIILMRITAVHCSIKPQLHGPKRFYRTQHPPEGVVDLKYTLNKPKSENESPSKIAPLVILHGLFGSKQNWRSLAKSFAQRLHTPIYTIDLRNHGESPHTKEMTYDHMAQDIKHFLHTHHLTKVNLMGHSMGGKVAMHTALSSILGPEASIDNLIIVDMAPTTKNLSSLFNHYIDAMIKVREVGVKKQSEADAILKDSIPDPAVRQFILTNLKDAPSVPNLYWRVNLDGIRDAMKYIWDFPYENATDKAFKNPSLFIAGQKADYITPKNEGGIRRLFPNSKIEYVDSGHWVHAEKPDEFQKIVTKFLTENSK